MEELIAELVEEDTTITQSKLWVIVFNVKTKGKGCAIVKAPNANEANNILKSNGMYNGTPEEYLITMTEEVITPPCCGLMTEQVVEFFNNN